MALLRSLGDGGLFGKFFSQTVDLVLLVGHLVLQRSNLGGVFCVRGILVLGTLPHQVSHVGHKRVVSASQAHFVVGEGNDTVLLLFHKHLKTRESLAVGVVVGSLQRIEFRGLLVQTFLQAGNLGFAGRELGIQFLQFGSVGLRTGAVATGGGSAFACVVQLVNETLDFGSLGLNGTVLSGKLAAVVVAGALHLLILLHDVVQAGLHFVDGGSVLGVLVAGNKAACSHKCNSGHLENRYLSYCLHCIYVFNFRYVKNNLYFCNRIAKINLFF